MVAYARTDAMTSGTFGRTLHVQSYSSCSISSVQMADFSQTWKLTLRKRTLRSVFKKTDIFFKENGKSHWLVCLIAQLTYLLGLIAEEKIVKIPPFAPHDVCWRTLTYADVFWRMLSGSRGADSRDASPFVPPPAPYTTMNVSSYYYKSVLMLLYVASYYYICVLILQYMCPHAALHMSSYSHIYVLILLSGSRGEKNFDSPPRATARSRHYTN